MKIFKNKTLLNLLISIICLFLILLFYFLSKLVNVLFNPIIVIVSSIVVIGLIVCQIAMKNNEKISKIITTVNEYIQILLIAVLLVEFIFTFFAFPASVDGESMFPTFIHDDRVLTIRTNEFKNNDIVVVRYDFDIQSSKRGIKDDELLVKRIIASPGQTFNYIGTDLYIDGNLVEDPFSFEGMNGLNVEIIAIKSDMVDECLQPDGSFIIPEGWYVILGDNRQNSTDSRAFGFVHESQILGVIKYKINSVFDWETVK